MSNVKSNISIMTNTLDEAWQCWFDLLSDMNLEQGSRDGGVVGEVINAVTVIDNPTLNIMKNPIRNLSMKYAIGELLWYLSGNNKLSAIKNYTKAWDRMSDDGITVNSNYGYCIYEKFGFDQWNYIKELLKKDKNSRQAVIHIKEPKNTLVHPTKDLNCTVSLQFLIREMDGEDKLFMTVYMRSNDLWLGFPFDIFQFTCMQIRMAMELNVGIGSYTHIAGSLHLYERDCKKNEVGKEK